MDAVLSRLDGGEFVGLVLALTAILSVAAVLITGIVVPQWQKLRRAEGEQRLKRELVTAGYSADDIERIVRASAAPTPRRGSEAVYACRR